MWNLLNNPVYKFSFQEVMYLADHGFLPTESQIKGFWGCSYFSEPEEMESMVLSLECDICEHVAVDMEMGNFFERMKDFDE